MHKLYPSLFDKFILIYNKNKKFTSSKYSLPSSKQDFFFSSNQFIKCELSFKSNCPQLIFFKHYKKKIKIKIRD